VFLIIVMDLKQKKQKNYLLKQKKKAHLRDKELRELVLRAKTAVKYKKSMRKEEKNN